MTITEFIEAAAHNKIIQLVVLAIVCDTVFGVLRAIKEKKFNSCAGIDGAIRKVGMLISLVFMLAIDVLIKINLIGFIPEQARTYLGLDTVGVAEFFALLYIAYEVVSIFKNIGIEMCVRKKNTKSMGATDKDWYFEDATVEATA